MACSRESVTFTFIYYYNNYYYYLLQLSFHPVAVVFTLGHTTNGHIIHIYMYTQLPTDQPTNRSTDQTNDRPTEQPTD
jgi:hypothetical protein